MKYTLNEEYNGDFLTTQCGYIFKKDKETEVKADVSGEVERYIEQRFIIPVSQEANKLKKDIKEKSEQLDKITPKIEKPSGASTQSVEEKSFKPADNKPSVPTKPDEIKVAEKKSENNSK